MKQYLCSLPTPSKVYKLQHGKCNILFRHFIPFFPFTQEYCQYRDYVRKSLKTISGKKAPIF